MNSAVRKGSSSCSTNITGMNSAVRKGSSSCSTNITGMNSAVQKGSSFCSTNITGMNSAVRKGAVLVQLILPVLYLVAKYNHKVKIVVFFQSCGEKGN